MKSSVPNVPMKDMGKKMSGSSVNAQDAKSSSSVRGTTFPNEMKGGSKPSGTSLPNASVGGSKPAGSSAANPASGGASQGEGSSSANMPMN